MLDTIQSPPPSSGRSNGFGIGIKLLSVIVLLCVLFVVRNIILLSFVGVLFSVLISFPTRLLSKFLPRGISVLLTFVLFLALIGTIGILTFPKISEQFQSLVHRLPEAVAQAQSWFTKIKSSKPVAQLQQRAPITGGLTAKAESILESGVKSIFPAAKGILEFLATLIFIFAMAIFLVIRPENYKNGIRRLIPTQNEDTFNEAFNRLSRGLQHWVGGILISMTLIGTLTAVGLAIAGIDDWFLLSVLTFFGTFVPYLGAISSAVPGLIIGISQSPKHFFFALLVYLAAHVTEGYIVQPLIMRRAIELKPAVLLLGQATFATLFGILGVIVATPMIGCFQVLIQYFYIERRLGKIPTDEQKKNKELHQAA